MKKLKWHQILWRLFIILAFFYHWFLFTDGTDIIEICKAGFTALIFLGMMMLIVITDIHTRKKPDDKEKDDQDLENLKSKYP